MEDKAGWDRPGPQRGGRKAFGATSIPQHPRCCSPTENESAIIREIRDDS
jgi:hypothetical protein